jgi:hypothetical protein
MSHWKHRLSLSKSSGEQTFFVGVKNPNNVPIFVNVQVTGVDGSGDTFTANSGVIRLGPGQNMVNIAISQPFDQSLVGETFTFNSVIQWGTSASSLTQTSTLSQGAPTSGSFTIVG